MDGNRLSPLPTIRAKVAVNCNHNAPGIKFDHSHQTEIGQIWSTVSIAAGEVDERSDIAIAVECQTQHLILHQGEDIGSGFEVKGSFSQNRLSRQQGLCYLFCDIHGPNMMLVGRRVGQKPG